MASRRRKRAAFFLATPLVFWTPALILAACNGLVDLGGAGDRDAGSPGAGAVMTGGTGGDGAGGSGGTVGAGGMAGVGATIDSSVTGGATASGGASSGGVSGSGGASGGSVSDSGTTGGTTAAGGSSSGGATASGGASSGGAPPDASTSNGGTAGAGGASNAACSNGVKDGDETDVDCGGSCRPCGLGDQCAQTSDCSATAAGCDVTLGGCACDAQSHQCVASHCVDHSRDATESDVDCGGLCDGCVAGEKCHADTDCSLFAVGCDRCTCDHDTSTCVHDHCLDHKIDVDETDVDCGGSKCGPCPGVDACRVDADCVTNACDLATLHCITDQCADHRKDGAESDADCGGGVCAICGVGQHCFSNIDCNPGHVCNASRICQ